MHQLCKLGPSGYKYLYYYFRFVFYASIPFDWYQYRPPLLIFTEYQLFGSPAGSHFIDFEIPSYGYNCSQITFIISPFDFSCRLRCEKWYYMPYLVENRDFGHIGHVSSLSGGQITWPSARNIFFLFANDSTPSKRYIYIYYTTKSAKWFPRYVGFRIWGVRGVNHPPKGGKRGRKIGTRLDSVYWTPIGPKKLKVPKWTCKMSMITYQPRLKWFPSYCSKTLPSFV